MTDKPRNVPHEPVLLDSVVLSLITDDAGAYSDASFGRGGHTTGLLARLREDARLLVLDRDPDAVAVARELASTDPRVQVIHGKFSDIAHLAHQRDIFELDGVLFDAGASTPQLTESSRGFSYRSEGPLDMRMDNSQGITAKEWLSTVSEAELFGVLRTYGEERNARRIARAVIRARPVTTTTQLAEIVQSCSSTRDIGKHPATRVFQAVRIRINDELRELEVGIEAAFSLLKVGGRIAVITFHSLEHRIVRQKFRDWTHPKIPRRMPIRDVSETKAKIVVKNGRPSANEVLRNDRARSAMLQVIERVA